MLVAGACAKGAAQAEAQAFPHITINSQERWIELEARVPITLDDPDAPFVYLELIACIPDTKEHEVLVVTPARPSHVHAALLLLGLTPGEPGSWAWDGETMTGVPPSGDPVSIELIYTNEAGERVVSRPHEWIVNAHTNEPFPEGHWVFAGSRIVDWQGEEFYDADGAGVLIGLTTFGSEVLAWPEVISHDSQVEEPVWIANAQTTPALDTPVTVRIRAMDR